jgi:hypothetical protein
MAAIRQTKVQRKMMVLNVLRGKVARFFVVKYVYQNGKNTQNTLNIYNAHGHTLFKTDKNIPNGREIYTI